IHAVDAWRNDALPIRQIHRGRRSSIQADAVHIANDADDLNRWPRRSAGVKLLANGILARPQTVSRNGRHDRNTSVAISFAQEPALPRRDAHRPEVIRIDRSDIAQDALGDGRGPLRPTTLGSALKRRRQRSSLRRTTWSRPR